MALVNLGRDYPVGKTVWHDSGKDKAKQRPADRREMVIEGYTKSGKVRVRRVHNGVVCTYLPWALKDTP